MKFVCITSNFQLFLSKTSVKCTTLIFGPEQALFVIPEGPWNRIPMYLHFSGPPPTPLYSTLSI